MVGNLLEHRGCDSATAIQQQNILKCAIKLINLEPTVVQGERMGHCLSLSALTAAQMCEELQECVCWLLLTQLCLDSLSGQTKFTFSLRPCHYATLLAG